MYSDQGDCTIRSLLVLCLAKTSSRCEISLSRELGGRFGGGVRLEGGSPVTTEHIKENAQHDAQSGDPQLSRRSSVVSLRIDPGARSGGQIVAMMESAEIWRRHKAAAYIGSIRCLTTAGCSLRQRKMRAVAVVVTDVLMHEAFQMRFDHNDHMVEQIAAAVADPTVGGHVEPSTVKKQLQRALRLRGVHPFVLFALRHTFLTRLGAAGCDGWTLARIAGHSSIAMPARYVHPSQDAPMNIFSRLRMPKELPSTIQ